jgi:hypothetical protein
MGKKQMKIRRSYGNLANLITAQYYNRVLQQWRRKWSSRPYILIAKFGISVSTLRWRDVKHPPMNFAHVTAMPLHSTCMVLLQQGIRDVHTCCPTCPATAGQIWTHIHSRRQARYLMLTSNIVSSIGLWWCFDIVNLFKVLTWFKPCNKTMQVLCRMQHWDPQNS